MDIDVESPEAIIFITLILLVVLAYSMITNTNTKERKKKQLEETIDKYFDTLYIKYNQLIYKNDYGQIIYDKWFKEVKFFINKVLLKDIPDLIFYYSIESINDFFNSYFSELLNLKKNKKQEGKISVKTGIDYEYYVEEYFKKLNYNVSRTPKTGDQGADLIVVKNGIKTAVQCKYYSKSVGNKAVQEVIAGKNFYQCDKAMVVSNAVFTKSARQLAYNSDVDLMNVVPEI